MIHIDRQLQRFLGRDGSNIFAVRRCKLLWFNNFATCSWKRSSARFKLFKSWRPGSDASPFRRYWEGFGCLVKTWGVAPKFVINFEFLNLLPFACKFVRFDQPCSFQIKPVPRDKTGSWEVLSHACVAAPGVCNLCWTVQADAQAMCIGGSSWKHMEKNMETREAIAGFGGFGGFWEVPRLCDFVSRTVQLAATICCKRWGAVDF